MEEQKQPMANADSAAASPRAPRERSNRNGTARRGGRYGPRVPRNCPFCVEKVKTIDYKQVEVLRRYLTDHGKIKARRKIGTCAKHQRLLASAIKRARHIALLPFVTEHTRAE